METDPPTKQEIEAEEQEAWRRSTYERRFEWFCRERLLDREDLTSVLAYEECVERQEEER
jgi:hypothetical protein